MLEVSLVLGAIELLGLLLLDEIVQELDEQGLCPLQVLGGEIEYTSLVSSQGLLLSGRCHRPSGYEAAASHGGFFILLLR